LIANGRLKPGEQLPTVQIMAEQLDINLHTVRNAYRKLEAEGLVEIRQGRGTHVLPFDMARIMQMASAERSHTVGVIVPSWSNPFYHALLHGVEEVATEDDTLLFLCNSNDDPNTACRHLARLAARQVDGILIASHEIFPAQQPPAGSGNQFEELPIVSIDMPESAGYSVMVDLKQAGYQATQHLAEHGHRRIGLITFSIDIPNVIPVNSGYERALEEYGLTVDLALIARVPGFDQASGATGARKLLYLNDPPTAIFAISDMLALGAMQAIKKMGRHIPGDIALIGFNNIPAGELVEPALSSVASPTQQMGREAMKILQALIAGKKPPHRQITFPTTLVVRESCGCQRKEVPNYVSSQ
jgi:DNA-binding LacI/PurR family transcriptional regulator